jgi:hypothetical protein
LPAEAGDQAVSRALVKLPGRVASPDGPRVAAGNAAKGP